MSQQDLNAFADWLVANPNKKGTPQYDTIAKAFKELDGQLNPKDTSFSSAFQSGVDAPLENMATTARMVGAEATADTLSGLTDAPTNYESASNRVGNPQEGDFTVPTPFGDIAPGYLPRAAAEQAGQFAGSLATRAGGVAVGGLVAGPGGAVAGGLAGPALFEFVQQLGPVAQERARNNGREEPTWEDWTAAAGTAGLSGALNSIGVKGFNGAGLLNRTLKEGVTEGTQSVVEQTGSTAGTDAGFNVDPKQAMVEGIIGGTSAGGVSAATDTVSGAANLTGRGLRAAKDAVIPSDTPSDAEAAADFAADLERVAAQDGYNLKDVDTGSEIGARAAIDTLHSEYGSQIEVMVKDLADRLKETADDTQLQALEKAKANAAKRKAKNKVKSRVDPTDFQVIEKLTAGTQEGAQLIALMRKSNELSALANKSVKGGISQFTDVFNPLDSDGRYNIGRAIAAPVSGLSAIASGGASLAPAIAGRAIDAVTGRRSRVANYVKQNQGNQGIQIPNLPSERTRKQQEKDAKDQANAKLQADREQANRELGRQGAAPTPGSPQDRVEEATGLTKTGVAQIVAIIDRISPNEAIKKAIAEYRTSIDTGGTISNDMLSPLIRQINVMLDGDERLGSKRVREPVRNQDGSPIIASTESPNYQRGIQSNLKIAQDQIDKVDADNNMSDFDKMVAKDALRELTSNLGSNPIASAEGILNKALVKARKKDKVRQYVQPYVDRVSKQQKAPKEPMSNQPEQPTSYGQQIIDSGRNLRDALVQQFGLVQVFNNPTYYENKEQGLFLKYSDHPTSFGNSYYVDFTRQDKETGVSFSVRRRVSDHEKTSDFAYQDYPTEIRGTLTEQGIVQEIQQLLMDTEAFAAKVAETVEKRKTQQIEDDAALVSRQKRVWWDRNVGKAAKQEYLDKAKNSFGDETPTKGKINKRAFELYFAEREYRNGGFHLKG